MRPHDFVEQLRMSTAELSPPVRSLMDTDFYKFTMGQLIHRHFPDVEVTFRIIIRDNDIPVWAIIDEQELRNSLDFAQGLSFPKTDLYYLRGIDLYDKYMFGEDYLSFLRTFRLPSYQMNKVEGGFSIDFTGPWASTSVWETIGLAIVSELYYRALMRKIPKHELEIVYARAMSRLYTKLETIRSRERIRFADFGQRRRHSFLWQEWVLGLCKKMMGGQFTGTSNTWMAFHHNLDAIGTNAHELPMVLTALANSEDEMRHAQYRVLELWQEMYGQGLRIFLPDTYGSAQFFKHAPTWLRDWRGQRQDSGDTIVEGCHYMNWLRKHGVDPAARVTVFSDGNDVQQMIRVDSFFGDEHPHPFGWGTLLTNDFATCHTDNKHFRPFSMVCKVVSANGRPCVKLSNNIKKATGPQDEVKRYLQIFGHEGRVEQSVVV